MIDTFLMYLIVVGYHTHVECIINYFMKHHSHRRGQLEVAYSLASPQSHFGSHVCMKMHLCCQTGGSRPRKSGSELPLAPTPQAAPTPSPRACAHKTNTALQLHQQKSNRAFFFVNLNDFARDRASITALPLHWTGSSLNLGHYANSTRTSRQLFLL